MGEFLVVVVSWSLAVTVLVLVILKMRKLRCKFTRNHKATTPTKNG